jgi:hypothetical protein
MGHCLGKAGTAMQRRVARRDLKKKKKKKVFLERTSRCVYIVSYLFKNKIGTTDE